MKLLIITQKVDQNDAILGFFHDWLEEFVNKVEQLHVISLFVGEYHLPTDVKVYSLGKEKGRNKFFRYLKFYQLIFELLPKCDKVLAHMCPEYICALAPINIFYQKDLYLWYVHRQVSSRLKLAEKLVKKIFTASAESFQLPSQKKVILGHGIDLEKYQIRESRIANRELRFNIIYVGRISRIKNQKLLIEAINLLIKKKNFTNLKVSFIGAPILTADKLYLVSLQELIKKLDLQKYFEFIEKVSNRDIVSYYQAADLSVNLSPTGGLDKAVLESMACGLPVIVVNQSFRETLGEDADKLIINEDPQVLADKILMINNLLPTEKKEMAGTLRKQIEKYHNLDDLIGKIIKEME